MCLFKARLFRLSGFALSLLACVLVWAVFVVPAAGEEDEFDKLMRFRNEFSSPFEDVPPDHWAYKAVKHLADIGLLEGYRGKEFLGNRVVTRYELAVLISRILDNYVELEDRGSLRVRRQVVAPMKSATIGAPAASAERPAGRVREGEVEYRRIEPREKVIVPAGEPDESIWEPEAAPGELMRRGPSAMETAMEPAEPGAGPAPVSVGFEEIEKKIELTQKDVDELDKLINSFRKELKDINKKLKKELSAGKKISLKNEREIKKLKDENERFNITGENNFRFQSFGPTHGREDAGADIEDEVPTASECPDDYPDCLTDLPASEARKLMRQVYLVDTIKLKIKSKPKPKEDLTFGATLVSRNPLTGTGGTFIGVDTKDKDTTQKYTIRAETPLMFREVYVDYQNTKEDPKNPKNFKLRQMKLGEISLTYSPLTAFMKNLTGALFQFKLNRYTIDLFGARINHHRGSVFSSQIDSGSLGEKRYFDRYFYGASLGFPLFGEELSMNKITKTYLFDDVDTPYPGCLGHTGEWVDIVQDYDIRTSSMGLSDPYYKDVFCLPEEKNSVTSFFTRYPLFNNKVIFTGEYAHSTYYKPGYNAMAPGTEECDLFGATDCFEIPEQNHQDDAFLVMFEYSKPPIKIFPIGYGRLGPKFNTKFFGFPGLDTDALLGGSGMFLPISIQSMELWIGGAGIDRIIDKNYSYDTIYAKLREIEPIYFDVGEMLAMFDDSEMKATITEVLPKPVNFINNRTNLLDIVFWTNKFKYVLSDKVSMKAEFMNAKIKAPTTCVDSNLFHIKDDRGNIIDIKYGDGVADCENGPDINRFGLDVAMTEQKYILNWATSKTTDYRGIFKVSELSLSFKWDNAVEGVINDLAPRGKAYTFYNELTHKLTQSTDLTVGYAKAFDTYSDPDSDTGDYPVIDHDVFYFDVNTRF